MLVSIDTLRADRLALLRLRARRDAPPRRAGARGRPVRRTPTATARSRCPRTPRSSPACCRRATVCATTLGFALEAKHRTARRRFQDAGYATGGAVSAYVLRARDGHRATASSCYDDALETRRRRRGAWASCSATARSRWRPSRAGSRPRATGRFFAFLHLYEPHTPYTPPATHRERLADPYDGEVAYADELVGRLLERLRGAGRYDRAIVAVTSDHGEGLGDHGEQEHGFFLYREALQVPLVLRLPGGARGRHARARARWRRSTSPATLLDLAGLPADGMDGVSLRAALDAAARPRARSTPRPSTRATTSAGASCSRRPRTATASSARREPELYDLKTDPGRRPTGPRSSRPDYRPRRLAGGALARGRPRARAGGRCDTREARGPRLRRRGWSGACPPRPAGSPTPRTRSPSWRPSSVPSRGARRAATRRRWPSCARSSPTARACSTRGRPSACPWPASGGKRKRSGRSRRPSRSTPRARPRTSAWRGSTRSPAERTSSRRTPRRRRPGGRARPTRSWPS